MFQPRTSKIHTDEFDFKLALHAYKHKRQVASLFLGLLQ